MKIITEIELREDLKTENLKKYRLNEHERLTPAARQYLQDRKIEIVQHEYGIQVKASSTGKTAVNQMTDLSSKEQVCKHHPRIKLRGQIDSLHAFLLELELLIEAHQLEVLLEEVKQVTRYVRGLIKSEASGEKLAFIDYYGWTAEAIQRRSHYPKKYFGIGHFRAHYTDGYVMVALNRLRTYVREVELTASEAFANAYEQHMDILLGLNRLSSVAYIMMCKLKAGQYE